MLDRRLCVAPMMDRTDRHFRYFLRLLDARVLLFTEMTPAEALRRADPARWLAHDPRERPLALQLGGAEPAALARGAELGAAAGYDEINLNVGCPSPRAASGSFGACLMREPARVAACVAAMRAASPLPVTVKCRLGVDDQDPETALSAFVAAVAAAGCRTFYVHARKAWLAGLNPKQNRNLPPLDYDRVRRLKAEFPRLEIVVNGGIGGAAAARARLAEVDGVMLGRTVCDDPWRLRVIARELDPDAPGPAGRLAALEAFLPYLEAQAARGVPPARMTRRLGGLFRGRAGAREWRRLTARPEAAAPAALLAAARRCAAERPGCAGVGRRAAAG